MQIQGKAIVIGASSGIGKGLAQELVKYGYLVGITGRREKNLLDIQKTNPGQFYVKAFDVQNTEEAIRKLEELAADMGGFDLLVYCSGIGDENIDLDFNIELNTVHTNIVGFTNIITHVYKRFKRLGYGHIVCISSIAGFRGNPFFPAYSASKAYMLNYVESLRMKSKKEGTNIIITDLRPGFVKTGHVDPKKMFWGITVEQAVIPMMKAIRKRKEVAYIKRKWWIISLLMKLMPRWIYSRLPF